MSRLRYLLDLLEGKGCYLIISNLDILHRAKNCVGVASSAWQMGAGKTKGGRERFTS